MEDQHPGRPRILFVALAHSTHTHSWVELLKEKKVNVRVFGIGQSSAPGWDTFKVHSLNSFMPNLRFLQSPAAGNFRFATKLINSYNALCSGIEDRYLARLVLSWRPDVVHTLGLDPASFVYSRVRKNHKLERIGRWVVTARGGPELSMGRLIPANAGKIREVLAGCDKFIADNLKNYDYALGLGLDKEKLSGVGVIPGTGGIDTKELSALGAVPPSKRERIILFPKAYECPASKALPVFEALKLCWDHIKPCTIHMTAMIPETRMWLQTLPSEILQNCHSHDRLPRKALLELMSRSRVMLAPSLTDGIPNVLYESMALKSFPIVSPLETFVNVIAEERNTLFARNLYPEEIARCLTRAMSDDALVDMAAANNLELVMKIADRAVISEKILALYDALSQAPKDIISQA